MVDPQEFTPPYPTDTANNSDPEAVSSQSGAAVNPSLGNPQNPQAAFDPYSQANLQPNLSPNFGANFSQFTAPSQSEYNNLQAKNFNPINPENNNFTAFSPQGFDPVYGTNVAETPKPPVNFDQNLQNAFSDAGFSAINQPPLPATPPPTAPLPTTTNPFIANPNINTNPENTNFAPAPNSAPNPYIKSPNDNEALQTPFVDTNPVPSQASDVQASQLGQYDQAPQGYTYTDNGYLVQGQEPIYAEPNPEDPNGYYDPNQDPDGYYDPNQEVYQDPNYDPNQAVGEAKANTFAQSTTGNRLFIFIGIGVVVLLLIITIVLFAINSNRISSTDSNSLSSIDNSASSISSSLPLNQQKSSSIASFDNQSSIAVSSVSSVDTLPPLSQTGGPNTPATQSRLRNATRIPTEWLREKFTSKDLDQFGNCAVPAICSNLSDPDQDGLTNIDEYNFDLDPLRADVDADGLADGDELFVYYTSPRSKDSDRDGFVDAVEISNCYDPTSSEASKMGQARVQEIVQNAQLKPINAPTTNTLQTSGATIEELRQGIVTSKCDNFVSSLPPTLLPSPVFGDGLSSSSSIISSFVSSTSLNFDSTN